MMQLIHDGLNLQSFVKVEVHSSSATSTISIEYSPSSWNCEKKPLQAIWTGLPSSGNSYNVFSLSLH